MTTKPDWLDELLELEKRAKTAEGDAGITARYEYRVALNYSAPRLLEIAAVAREVVDPTATAEQFDESIARLAELAKEGRNGVD